MKWQKNGISSKKKFCEIDLLDFTIFFGRTLCRPGPGFGRPISRVCTNYLFYNENFLGYFTSISVDLQARRDMIVSILEEAGLPPVVPEGGYFIMADWTPFSEFFLY